MAAQSGGVDSEYATTAATYWSSIRYCGNQTSTWIYLLAIGLVVKRWDVVSGPFTKNMSSLLIYLVVPVHQIASALTAEVGPDSLGLILSILPFWLLKLGFAGGISYTVTKLVTIPNYFTRTFYALLMIDSQIVPNVYYLAAHGLVRLSGTSRQNDSRSIYSEAEFIEQTARIQAIIRVLNSLLLLGVGPWLLKNDYLYLKTFGKSTVWINQEPYLAKFEMTDLMDQQNYELLVQTRAENKAYLTSHLKHLGFLSAVVSLGFLLLKQVVTVPASVSTSIESGLRGVSDLCIPASMIVLGCLITKLDVGFKRGLMVSSKLAVIHAGSKLYLIPKLLLLLSSLISKLFPESGSLVSLVGAELARASSWPPDVIILLYSVELSFGYKEVAYFIYYDWMISLLSLPMLMWQWS